MVGVAKEVCEQQRARKSNKWRGNIGIVSQMEAQQLITSVQRLQEVEGALYTVIRKSGNTNLQKPRGSNQKSLNQASQKQSAGEKDEAKSKRKSAYLVDEESAFKKSENSSAPKNEARETSSDDLEARMIL